jgi:hypothetical protein
MPSRRGLDDQETRGRLELLGPREEGSRPGQEQPVCAAIWAMRDSLDQSIPIPKK